MNLTVDIKQRRFLRRSFRIHTRSFWCDLERSHHLTLKLEWEHMWKFLSEFFVQANIQLIQVFKFVKFFRFSDFFLQTCYGSLTIFPECNYNFPLILINFRAWVVWIWTLMIKSELCGGIFQIFNYFFPTFYRNSLDHNFKRIWRKFHILVLKTPDIGSGSLLNFVHLLVFEI